MSLPRKSLKEPTRRTFLGWWMASILTATAVAALSPIAVYIFPPRNPNQTKQKRPVALDPSMDAVKEGDVPRFAPPAGLAFVMAHGGEGNAAGARAFAGY